MKRVPWTIIVSLLVGLPTPAQQPKQTKPREASPPQVRQEEVRYQARNAWPPDEEQDPCYWVGRLALSLERVEELKPGTPEFFKALPPMAASRVFEKCATLAKTDRNHSLETFALRTELRWRTLVMAGAFAAYADLRKDYDDFRQSAENYIRELEKHNAAMDDLLKTNKALLEMTQANERFWKLWASRPQPPAPPPLRDPITCTGRVMNLGPGMATTYTTCQ